MKLVHTLLATSLLIVFSSVHAEDTASAQSAPAVTPDTAKQIWQQMTPEQQQAMKDQAKTTAQGKQAAWQQMSPEERQAKMQGMRSRMQERMSQFRASKRR